MRRAVIVEVTGIRPALCKVSFDMPSDVPSEPDQHGLVIYVGQDRAGHWLVQDSAKRLEGRFVSRAAAVSYALAEGEIYHAPVTLTPAPMVPLVPFVPPAAHERVLARAA